MRPKFFTKEHVGAVVLVQDGGEEIKATITGITPRANYPIQLSRNGRTWYSVASNGVWLEIKIIKLYTTEEHPEEYL